MAFTITAIFRNGGGNCDKNGVIDNVAIRNKRCTADIIQTNKDS